ncbi:MAG TPA: CehA/McbA family metallohydrolase [Bryobacteraceae bacterium]|nr:CehA/McbA family metallohydrolase [Bryobacteraceae bacterium]
MRYALFLRFLLVGLFVFALVQSAQVSRDATLSVRIVDSAGRPTPARIRIQDSHGARPRGVPPGVGALAVSESALPVPRQAIAVMWGQQDRAQGYAVQPDGSFYADGAFELRLPPGAYTLTVSKGFEYLRQTADVALAPGATVARVVRLERWTDLPARGWYSSDDHIHLRRSPGDDPAILRWIAAEDIHVGHILEMGDFWATFYSQYAFGEKGRYVEGDRVLSAGQEEPRTPEIGHTISLGASQMVRDPRDYYSFDRLFDRVHQLGGVTGFAHQGVSFHGYRGMVLNTLRGKTDFLEVAQFCVPGGPLVVENYYRFLDLGYKLTALAGSDFPWCGQGPAYGFQEPQFAQIGNARFYAYAGEPFSWERWFAAMRAGHTFVSTGPAVFLTVNGHLPGDSIDVAPGTSLRIHAEAFGHTGQVPLRSLEIVGHGRTMGRSTGAGVAHLSVDVEVPARHGIWIAAKCDAGNAQVAHTTPVYVTVAGDGFHNPENLARNLEIAEGSLKELEGELANPGMTLDSQAPRHREQLERQISEARAKLKSMAALR